MKKEHKTDAFEAKQLQADIEYLDALIRDAADSLRETINRRTMHTENPALKLDAVTDAIALELARLSARLSVIEQVLADGGQDTKAEARVAAAGAEPGSLYPELHLGARELANNRNMLAPEQSDDGVLLAWTGADTTTAFRLPIMRDRVRELRITVNAFIKQEFAKSLRITIDDKPVPHRFRTNGNAFNYICRLPRSEAGTATTIGISLPATHSPRELGLSDDDRKLGVAISGIDVYARQGGLAGWLGNFLGR